MSNCDNDINSQIKALHARLDRVDEHLLSHTFQSIADAYAMIASGPLNPALVARGTVKLAESISYKFLMSLAKQIPGYEEFKNLMYLDSAAIVDSLEYALLKTVDTMVETAVKDLENAIDNKIKAYVEHLFAILDPLGIRTLGGTASGSTTSTTITSSNTAVSTYIVAGDSILLASSGSILGTVSTADEISITLTSNSSATFTDQIIAYTPINPDAIVAKLLGNLNEATAALNKTNAAISGIKLFLKTLKDISACNAETAILRKNMAAMSVTLDAIDAAAIDNAAASFKAAIPPGA